MRGTFERIRQDSRKRNERADELAHEQKLANVRARSRAIVWTGPADELID